ncbi:hypothetical protein SDC9_163665 [bioreactor metagenome]|uniref:Uncharacterized protein n=1 Tax=bioreactor metagenome TaxID=1076179 RepID=A0A645FRI1_9ZZZZ
MAALIFNGYLDIGRALLGNADYGCGYGKAFQHIGYNAAAFIDYAFKFNISFSEDPGCFFGSPHSSYFLIKSKYHINISLRLKAIAYKMLYRFHYRYDLILVIQRPSPPDMIIFYGSGKGSLLPIGL